MLQRKWGMHHPQRGNGMPQGGKINRHTADGGWKTQALAAYW
jgi:hypothetical protein